jgi:hypothetical protein
MRVSMASHPILEQWKLDDVVIDAEITVGHVWMAFTGRIAYLSSTELVLSHPDGELSISLFCGSGRAIEPAANSDKVEFWAKYRQVFQVTTDGGAICTLHERRVTA